MRGDRLLDHRIVRACVLPLLAAALVAPPRPAKAQAAPVGPVTAGVGLVVSSPRGDFAETTNLGVGLAANALFRLDREAIFNVRAEASFLAYGSTRQRVPLSPTLGNLIQVDLRTTNSIASFLVGPQLLGPTGAFTPYAAALGGFSAFWTTSTLEGTNQQQPFASTTNASDFSWAYGGAAGTYVRVSRGERPVRLELGVRYLRHDDVTYLTANEVRGAFRDGRDPRVLRSRVDFYTYLVGVQAIVF
jgi:hypothetical protein